MDTSCQYNSVFFVMISASFHTLPHASVGLTEYIYIGALDGGIPMSHVECNKYNSNVACLCR